tara:strand:- start:260 stop:466 length:207 start_codon:yes stop_codon:yes gene_type:complete
MIYSSPEKKEFKKLILLGLKFVPIISGKIININDIIKKNISFFKLFEFLFLKTITKNNDKKIKGTLNL